MLSERERKERNLFEKLLFGNILDEGQCPKYQPEPFFKSSSETFGFSLYISCLKTVKEETGLELCQDRIMILSES
jgi:hypothetical protein